MSEKQEIPAVYTEHGFVKAVYTNRVNLTLTNDGMRLTFGESPTGGPENEHMHTGIFMTFSGITLLHNLLGSALARLQEQAALNANQKQN